MSGTSVVDVSRRYRAKQPALEAAMRAFIDGTGSWLAVDEATGVTGLTAELVKKNAERKLMHEMMTEAGIPEVSAGSGEGICLIGRLALALRR